MQSYFQNVIKAEKNIFGDIKFLPNNIHLLSIKSGDLNKLEKSQLRKALSSDVYVVFGASYIKSWLIDFLIEHKAINIHMGLSPYYRGSSCNFWALYDGKPGFVGATIHYLSKGLDSGDMLFHCLPKLKLEDSPYDFTMRSVLAAHQGLSKVIGNKTIFTLPKFKQDKSKEVRYTKNIDFNDAIVSKFFEKNIELDSEKILYPELLEPIFV